MRRNLGDGSSHVAVIIWLPEALKRRTVGVEEPAHGKPRFWAMHTAVERASGAALPARSSGRAAFAGSQIDVLGPVVTRNTEEAMRNRRIIPAALMLISRAGLQIASILLLMSVTVQAQGKFNRCTDAHGYGSPGFHRCMGDEKQAHRMQGRSRLWQSRLSPLHGRSNSNPRGHVTGSWRA